MPQMPLASSSVMVGVSVLGLAEPYVPLLCRPERPFSRLWYTLLKVEMNSCFHVLEVQSGLETIASWIRAGGKEGGSGLLGLRIGGQEEAVDITRSPNGSVESTKMAPFHLAMAGHQGGWAPSCKRS